MNIMGIINAVKQKRKTATHSGQNNTKSGLNRYKKQESNKKIKTIISDYSSIKRRLC